MTTTTSNGAKKVQPIVTSASLFRIASDAETTLEHLEQLVKMASEKLDNISPYTDANAALDQAAAVQTLLDAVAIYLGKMGDTVEAVYQSSHALPKTKAELAAIDEPDDVRKRA